MRWLSNLVDEYSMEGLVARGVGFTLISVLLLVGYLKLDQAGNRLPIALLGGVVGVTLGWLVGTLVAPTTRIEARHFSSYGNIISGFLSGFLVSKIDKIFELIVSEGLKPGQDLVFARTLVFVGCFITTTLLVYFARPEIENGVIMGTVTDSNGMALAQDAQDVSIATLRTLALKLPKNR